VSNRPRWRVGLTRPEERCARMSSRTGFRGEGQTEAWRPDPSHRVSPCPRTRAARAGGLAWRSRAQPRGEPGGARGSGMAGSLARAIVYPTTSPTSPRLSVHPVSAPRASRAACGIGRARCCFSKTAGTTCGRVRHPDLRRLVPVAALRIARRNGSTAAPFRLLSVSPTVRIRRRHRVDSGARAAAQAASRNRRSRPRVAQKKTTGQAQRRPGAPANPSISHDGSGIPRRRATRAWSRRATRTGRPARSGRPCRGSQPGVPACLGCG
jgi:hypothetical protein